ncbi:MAG TPA: LamG domain-containing protein [Polyangiaceae bacterium]|nr:LamG domain-containing protein [Polyangiaceae bacterium]
MRKLTWLRRSPLFTFTLLGAGLLGAAACSSEPAASDGANDDGANDDGAGASNDDAADGSGGNSLGGSSTGGNSSTGGSESDAGGGGAGSGSDEDSDADGGSGEPPVCVTADASLQYWWSSRVDLENPMLSVSDWYAAVREEMKGTHGSNIGSLSWSIAGDGPVGEAFVFGTPSNGTKPNYLHAYGDFPLLSVEFWVDTTKSSAPLVRTVSGSYVTRLVGGKLQAVFHDAPHGDAESPGTGPYTLDGTANVADGKPHHVVTTLDTLNLSFRLYIDGELVDSVALSEDFYFGMEYEVMGEVVMGGPIDPMSISEPASNYFTGYLDEVSLYNDVLSTEDVAGLFGASSAGKCLPVVMPE